MDADVASLTPVSRAVWDNFKTRAAHRVEQLAVRDDVTFKRSLRALGSVPAVDANLLINILFAWRDARIGSAKNALRRPELTVETIFLEGAIHVSATAVLAAPQRLIDVALKWTLYHAQFVARTATDTHTEALRAEVLKLSGQLLGLMSHKHLAVVQRAFLEALQMRLGKASDAAERQQIQQLCQGMRWVRLQVDTPEQLEASTQFLVDVHPLQHKAAARKSLVQHWICQTLTDVLSAYTSKHVPRRTRYPFNTKAGERWFSEVSRLSGEVSRWIKSHSKHVTEGYPFLTQLVCVLDDRDFLEQVDYTHNGLMDSVLKLMKDKSTRGLALECHVDLVHSYLLRFAPLAGVCPDPVQGSSTQRGVARDQVLAWVEYVVQPVMVSMRKGLWASEQQDLVRRLTLLVGHHLPDQAVDHMVGQLLAADASWECMLVGAQVLRNILDTAPDRRTDTQVWRSASAPLPSALAAPETRRVGGSPFDRYGIRHLEWRVAAMLKAVQQLCHQTVGQHITTQRQAPEYRDRPQALPVLMAVLRCVPYVLPEQWRGVPRHRMGVELFTYTVHVDQDLREVSARVLRACIRCYPDYREALLIGGLSVLSAIPDDMHQELLQTIKLLDLLMKEWLQILQEQLEQGCSGTADAAFSSTTVRFDVHHMEGMALVLLAHGTPAVRSSAWDLLSTARRLHRMTLQVAISEQPDTPAAQSDFSATAVDVGANVFQRRDALLDTLADTTYLLDIVEQSGGDMLQQCYWDFGPWSNLWAPFRAHDDIDDTFRSVVLFRPHPPDCIQRTARLLGELTQQASLVCRASTLWAYTEAVNRLLRLREDKLSDSQDDRLVIPDVAADWRRELYLLYSSIAGAAAVQGPLKEARLSPSNLISALAQCLRTGIDWHLDLATSVLGHLHPTYYATLVQELQDVIKEYTSLQAGRTAARSKARKEDLRLSVAHIWRQVASSMAPGQLKNTTSLRNELLRFLKHPSVFEALQKDTVQHDELTIDMLRLRFCLCYVVHCCGLQLGTSPAASSVFDIDLRSKLFDLVALWCREGYAVVMKAPDGGLYAQVEQAGVPSLCDTGAHVADGYVRLAKERVLASKRLVSKDPEAARVLERELCEAVDMVEQAAHQALAALLLGPAFDAHSRTKSGRPLSWINRMFRSHMDGAMGSAAAKLGPPKPSVAVRALTSLLECNPDMAGVMLDQCYSESQPVAVGYFQVLVEVFSLQGLSLQVHQLLALALFNLVHDRRDVRADALQLLNELAIRAWLQEGNSSTDTSTQQQGAIAVVIGSVQDSYQQFQFHLSAKLAREHPKLSEALVVEMLTRAQGLKHLRPGVLACLAPWAENLVMPPSGWKGNWCGALLHALYHVMVPHERGHHAKADVARVELERLWSTLAVNKNNVLAMVDFIVAMGLEETAPGKGKMAQYFDSAKRAVLYLARTSSQQTVDSLVCELRNLQQQADEEGSWVQTSLRDSMEGLHGGTQLPTEFQRPAYSDKLNGRGAYQPATSGNSSLYAVIPREESVRSGDALRSSGGNYRSTSFRPPTGSNLQQFATDITAPIRKVANDFFKVTGITARSDSGSDRDGSRVSASFLPLAGDHMSGHASELATEYNSMLSRVNSGEYKGRHRNSLTRPELALCLLADVAYEQDEDLRMYLPLLVHVALVLMDSRSAILFQHCQQLLINLLNSLSARHLEVHHKAGTMLSEYRMVSSLISYLESMSGRRLWAYEDASWSAPLVPSCRALETLVDEVVGSVFFERDLSMRWAETALEWMVSCSCQHLASRSHQVYRALKPPLTQQGVGHLLNGLHKALSSTVERPQPVALEMLLTLQALVESSAPQELIKYPQLLLSCLPLLQLSFVPLFARVLELFTKVVSCIDLNDMVVQNVLLVSCPGSRTSGEDFTRQLARGSTAYAECGWWVVGTELFGCPADDNAAGSRLCVLQQLLIKGLYRPETEMLTIVALVQLLQQVARLAVTGSRRTGGAVRDVGPAFLTQMSLVTGLPGFGPSGLGSGLRAIVGDPELQVVLTMWSLLPWLCVRRSDKERLHLLALKMMKAAAAAVGYSDVADALLQFQHTDAQQLHSATSALCEALARATFPRYARMALQRLLEQLQQGAPEYRDPILVILATLLQLPRIDLGGALAGDHGEAFLLAPVVQMMQLEERNPLGPKALAVLEAALAYTNRQMMSTEHTPSDVRGAITRLRHSRDGLDGQTDTSNAPALLADWPEAVTRDAMAANKHALDVLGRLLSTGLSGGARSKREDSHAPHFMPFIR